MVAWWTSQQGGWIGGIGGSMLGLAGGFIGVASSILVPRGKGRIFMLSMLTFVCAISLVALLAGAWAWFVGQPYHVWYPLALGGFIGSAVTGALIPVTHARYRQMEHRRLEAETLRRG